eukprot:TRINITY_DN70041_c0_g1_i1.p1 TRINITY_DN70041_c0_g1~~TRINITY_DN70041_c0_g1_i1.p1  ORF type:complete len:451 (+),score=46.03 TRINITY_DN70041_c0_g1_i1:105-1457(+)
MTPWLSASAPGQLPTNSERPAPCLMVGLKGGRPAGAARDLSKPRVQSAAPGLQATSEAAIPGASESPREAALQDSGKSDETSSVVSELECPVCYQLFCEPVRASCDRHVFCRNCLLKSQRYGSWPALRCPVCRAESPADAMDVPEVTELVEKLRRKDAEYDARVKAAKGEREAACGCLRSWLPYNRSAAAREVSGAGCEEVNGVYVAGILPTYLGPTVYRKPNTYLFMFRWQHTQWAIAELRGPYSMGNERDWLYKAPTQYPPDEPPVNGWEVPTYGRLNLRPAGTMPEVRPLRIVLTAGPTLGPAAGVVPTAAPAGDTQPPALGGAATPPPRLSSQQPVPVSPPPSATTTALASLSPESASSIPQEEEIPQPVGRRARQSHYLQQQREQAAAFPSGASGARVRDGSAPPLSRGGDARVSAPTASRLSPRVTITVEAQGAQPKCTPCSIM